MLELQKQLGICTLCPVQPTLLTSMYVVYLFTFYLLSKLLHTCCLQIYVRNVCRIHVQTTCSKYIHTYTYVHVHVVRTYIHTHTCTCGMYLHTYTYMCMQYVRTITYMCMLYVRTYNHVSKLLTSISRPFHVRIVLSLGSTLHSLNNLVIVCCFPDFSTYVSGKIHTAKVLQINTISRISRKYYLVKIFHSTVLCESSGCRWNVGVLGSQHITVN